MPRPFRVSHHNRVRVVVRYDVLMQVPKAFWPWVSGALAITLVAQHLYYGSIRERADLLEQLAVLQNRWCEGVERINHVCEEQFVEVMQQLGLDNKLMPLMTTALWKRATGNFRVSQARRRFGAAEQAEKFLEPEDVLPPNRSPLDNLPARRIK